MTARSVEHRDVAVPAACRLHWLRLLAVATAAIALASCRALPSSAVLSTSAVISSTVSGGGETDRDETGRDSEDVQRDADVVRTGLEAPCPPLPRIGAGLRPQARRRPAGMPGAAVAPRLGRCETGDCETGDRPSGACEQCEPANCLPCDVPPPMVGPYLVCDGGDKCRPAQPIGADRLGNLTAGDTVARYRPDDEMPDSVAVRLVASNCACVFAPRFGAVREVTRPLEGAQPQGPRGLALDAGVELEETRQPACGKTQTVSLEAARKALPGVAVQERLGPLAVDQGDMPHADDGVVGPVEDVADQTPELERLRQRPLVKVGFDVPIAWTCIKAANVLLGDQAAAVVAVDRGTATLRFEEPGRAELTLCKRAGSDTARTGEELDFTIVMLNSGDRPLTGIVLADALPTRLAYIPDSAAASVPARFSSETGDDGSTVLTWRVEGTLRPGESGFVRFRTLVK